MMMAKKISVLFIHLLFPVLAYATNPVLQTQLADDNSMSFINFRLSG